MESAQGRRQAGLLRARCWPACHERAGGSAAGTGAPSELVGGGHVQQRMLPIAETPHPRTWGPCAKPHEGVWPQRGFPLAVLHLGCSELRQGRCLIPREAPQPVFHESQVSHHCPFHPGPSKAQVARCMNARLRLSYPTPQHSQWVHSTPCVAPKGLTQAIGNCGALCSPLPHPSRPLPWPTYISSCPDGATGANGAHLSVPAMADGGPSLFHPLSLRARSPKCYQVRTG